MAIFTVHIPAASAGEAPSVEKIVLLRDGFSFPATLLGPFWLAWNRAWIPAIGWTALLALILLAGVKLGASSDTLSLVNAALALLLGFEGSRLVAWSLERRHYKESAVIIGESADEAEEIFFHDWRGASALAPPPPPPPPRPPLGASEEPSV